MWKYGSRAVLLLLIGTALYSQNSGTGSSSIDINRYRDELVRKALDMKLHRDIYWHALLHYRKELFGYKSLVDDPGFFFSKKGKTDPKSELKYTIEAFFMEPQKGRNNFV